MNYSIKSLALLRLSIDNLHALYYSCEFRIVLLCITPTVNAHIPQWDSENSGELHNLLRASLKPCGRDHDRIGGTTSSRTTKFVMLPASSQHSLGIPYRHPRTPNRSLYWKRGGPTHPDPTDVYGCNPCIILGLTHALASRSRPLGVRLG